MKKVLLIVLILSIPITAWAFDEIFDTSEDDDSFLQAGSEGPGIELSGTIGTNLTYYIDDGLDSEVIAGAYSDLDLSITAGQAEGTLRLSLETEGLSSNLALSELVDEAYFRLYFSLGYLDAGFLKTEWGKGDGLHAIDILNPLDQTNGLTMDTLSMKRSEAMIALNLQVGLQGLMEMVYKPYYHPVPAAASGRWMAYDPADIPGTFSPLVPDTGTLEYSQAAARFTTSIGLLDIGCMYYFGFFPEPGFDINVDPVSFNITTAIEYTRGQLFGFEGAAAAGPFAFRSEIGYWLTEDRNGKETEHYNDRIVYLGGFDITIPRTSIFLSMQVSGEYAFDTDNLTQTDVDILTATDGSAHSTNILIVAEYPFYRDTMKLRLSGIYLYEGAGYMAVSEYFWNISDEVELRLAGQFFGGEDKGINPYFAWDKNDNLQLDLKFYY
jgi:hypothetical protein